ncbi:MAG: isoprenylcysteine carboxylmethyltransferase family protein [FCB group bacterium]|nr:isoprenylcysteine carboxylmethyltransferase family protein [FCB group bacterium]
MGLGISFALWVLFYFFDWLLDLPPFPIHPLLRLGLLIMFITDFGYLVIGGIIELKRCHWGQSLAVKGPYQFVRHPMYSAVVYSLTGFLAVGLKSILLLVSALPLSLVWSWLAQKEDRELEKRFGEAYRKYYSQTGEFFPNFKALAKQAKQK